MARIYNNIVETVGHRGQGLERLLDAAIGLVGPLQPPARLRLVA